MNKKYTRKQICEAIKHWQKQLKKMNEDYDDYDFGIWICACSSSLSENNFIQSFESQKEALDKAREIFDLDLDSEADGTLGVEYTSVVNNKKLSIEQAFNELKRTGQVYRSGMDTDDTIYVFELSIENFRDTLDKMSN